MITKTKRFISLLLVIIMISSLIACDAKSASDSKKPSDKETTPSSQEHTCAFSEWKTLVEPTCATEGVKQMLCSCGAVMGSETLPILSHVEGEWITDSEASCTLPGSKHTACTLCGSTVSTEEIPVSEHIAGNWIVDKAPTCTEKGSRHNECTVCGITLKTEDLSFSMHTASNWIIDKEATCAEDGSKHNECTVCGAVLNTEAIPAGAHKVGEWIIDSEPSCAEEGSKHNECTICGLTVDTEAIPALSHTEGEWIVDSEATCTEPGIRHLECSVCGLTIETEEFDALGHYEGSWIVDSEATCTQTGLRHLECSVCGLTIESEESPALGHVEGNWIVDLEATCTEDGSQHNECSVCGVTTEHQTIPATGHSTSDWTVVYAPTCITSGLKSGFCSACGEALEDIEIPALGHTAGNWIVDISPSCTQEGARHRNCETCGSLIEEEAISAFGHDFTEWFVLSEATCTSKGLRERFCQTCLFVQNEKLDETDHTWIDATCTAPKTCSACGTYEGDILGHTSTTEQCERCGAIPDVCQGNHDYVLVSSSRDCVNDSYDYYVCSRCNAVRMKLVPATGHDMSITYIASEATCISEGELITECAYCDHFITEIIPMTPHTLYTVTVEPTCVSMGYTQTKCSVCSYEMLDNYTQELGHDVSDITVAVDPTCTTEGILRYSCSRCALFYDDAIETIPHDYREIEGKLGYYTEQCTMCGSSTEELIIYYITYNLGDGLISNITEYTVESPAFVLFKPTLEGYTFVGWTCDGVTTPVIDYTVETGTTGDLLFTAAWNPNIYEITFDTNGGSMDNTPLSVTFGSIYRLPTPTKSGYSFDGWFDGNGTKYTNGTWSVAENVELFARWSPNEYTITLNDTVFITDHITLTLDYNYSGSVPTEITLANGQTVSYPTIPTRSGFAFAGWFTDAECTASYDFTADLTSDITVYAKWISTSSTVILPSSENTIDLTSYSVYYSFVALETGVHTISLGKNGYINCNENSGYGSLSISCVAGSLYTFYVESEYKNTGSSYVGETYLNISGPLPSDGGNAISSSVSGYIYSSGSTASVSVTYTQPFTLPVPTRLGYTFDGWYNGSNLVSDGTWSLTSGMTLTPKWTINSFVITLDAAGGTLSTNSINIAYGSRYSLPTPTKTGYTFSGWFDADGNQYSSGTWNNEFSVTLFASWTANRYTVTLEDTQEIFDHITVILDYNYSDSTPTEITLSNGQTLAYPTVPTRSNYVFAGWYTSSACTTPFSFSGTVTEDTTLYAKWISASSSTYAGVLQMNSNTGTVSFGTGSTKYAFVPLVNQTVTIYTSHTSGDPYLYLYNSSGSLLRSDDDGYSNGNSYITYSVTAGSLYYVDFKCWSSSYGNGVLYIDGDLPTSSAYASCSDVTGYIYADGESTDITVTYGQEILLPILIRDGYLFTGWETSDGTAVTSGTWLLDSGATLYPAWDANSYTVTLDANGGSVSQTEMDFLFGLDYALPTPTKTGYTFNGWFDAEGTQYSSGIWTLEEDITLFASWTANRYSVTLGNTQETFDYISITLDYNYNGLTDVITVANGQTLAYPSVPTRSGYAFAGWYTNSACTTAYSFSGAITEDVTLYAKWISASTSTYAGVLQMNSNTGTVSYYYSSSKKFAFVPLVNQTVTIYTTHTSGDPKIYLYNSSGTQLKSDDDGASTSLDSYISYSVTAGTLYYIDFKSYSDTSTGSGVLYLNGTLPTSTAYASCSDVTGHIYSNGASTSLDVVYGEELTLPLPTREGYTFGGWYNGTALVTSGTWLTDSDVTLTPSWTANSYTITFDAAGGTVDSPSITVEYESDYTLLTPTKVGHTFGGWFDENGNEYVSGTWTELASVELYASWTANEYTVTLENTQIVVDNITVTLNYNYSGSTPSVITLENGDTLAYPTNIPTRSGYAFAGWYTTSSCTTLYDFTDDITSDVTIYAKWVSVSYNGISSFTDKTIYLYPVANNNVSSSYFSFVALATGTHTISVGKGGYIYVNINGSSQSGYDSLSFSCTKGNLYTFYVESYKQRTDSTYVGNTYLRVSGPMPSSGGEAICSSAGGYLYSDTNSFTFDVTYGTSVTLPTPIRDGYTFGGWYNGDELVSSGIWSIDSDVSLSPLWLRNCTITLDGNGGDLSSTSIDITQGDSLTLPTPTRTGYTFEGWFDGDGNEITSGVWSLDRDVTLRASWTANEYSITLEDTAEHTLTVTFDYNYAGSVATEITLADGQVLAYPTVPTRSGYAFAGWYTDAGCTTAYSFSGTIEDDVTLYAKWISASTSTYAGVLQMNSSTASVYFAYSASNRFAFVPLVNQTVTIYTTHISGDPKIYLYNASGTMLTYDDDGADTSRDSFISYSVTAGNLYYVDFKSYGSSSQGYGVLYLSGSIPTSTSYASIPSDSLLVYSDGNSLTYDVTYDTSVTLPTPSRDGYTFGGWYNGDELVSSGIWSIDSDVTLSPLWLRNCTITLDAVGGNLSSTSIAVTQGDSFTLPVPTKAGHTFEGWFDGDGNEIASGVWSLDSDITLYASWTVNEYSVTLEDVVSILRVTFDYNYDGSAPAVVTLENGQSLAYPTVPTRSGYVFAGWYTDSDCTTAYSFSGTIGSDITLYAKWISVSSSTYAGILQMNSNTGTVYFSTASNKFVFVPLVSQTVKIFTSHTSGDPKIYLYDASGTLLASDDDGLSSRDSLITYSVTAGNLYYVDFKCWSESYGNGALYIEGILPTSTAYASHTSVPSYTYAEDEEITLSITYGEELTLPVLSRIGYTFLGWYTGDGIQISSGAYLMEEDVVLTPRWEPIVYNVTLENVAELITVTVDYNYSGSNPTTIRLLVGDVLAQPANPTRSGYIFTGWYTDSACSSPFDFSGDIGSSMTLYAGWTTYSVLNNSSYAWTMSDGVLLSTNTAQSSSSTYKITANGPMTVSFSYMVSSESGYDYLTIKKNSTQIARVSGSTSYVHTSVSLIAGDVLTFTYSKDGSVNNGYDRAYISNLTYSSSASSDGAVTVTNGEYFVYSTESTDISFTYSPDFALPVPVREGFAFDGWYIGDELVTNIWSLPPNAVLTPHWTQTM